MTQLILVGNGFDLAHGMKSSFGSFANSISPKTRNQWLLSLKKKNIEYGDGMWYDFEVLIEEITRKWFEDYFDIVVNNGDEKKVNEEVDEINESYNQITKTLIEYLLKEQEIKNYKKIESLSKEIKDANFFVAQLQKKENFILRSIVKTGTTVQSINMPDFSKLELSYPLNEEQKKLGDLFYEIDNLIALHHRKISKIKKIKKLYMRKMFL